MIFLLKLLLALTMLAILYSGGILQPQIKDVERKMKLPEFQGTVHFKAMEFTLWGLRRRFARLNRIAAFLAILTLAVYAFR